MARRRTTSPDLESARWCRTHRALLSDCGIPDAVADSERRWLYLLLHGDDPGTGWDASWISPAQAARLLGKLLADSHGESGYDLIRRLRLQSSDLDV